jgi:hypothetical protein
LQIRLKEMSIVDSSHKETENTLIRRSEIQTSNAGRGGSARYWKTPRKEKTAHKKIQDKETL